MEQSKMNTQRLIDTAQALLADGKGFLAMDESNPTGSAATAYIALLTAPTSDAVVIECDGSGGFGCKRPLPS
jgi:hypothetical protein